MRECKHEETATSYTYIKCKSCHKIFTGTGWGIASRKWFNSLDEAEFYQSNGRIPEEVSE